MSEPIPKSWLLTQAQIKAAHEDQSSPEFHAWSAETTIANELGIEVNRDRFMMLLSTINMHARQQKSPSNPAGISELVAKIGDENITVQNLIQNMTAVNVGKKDSKITFATSVEMGRQVAQSAAGMDATHIGLILWIRKDAIPPSAPQPATA